MDIDYSELLGKKVECIPECGLCCLCQPEVLPEERSFFKQNHPTALVRNKYPEDHYALALKKGRGSCVFLNNRRCSVYDKRPTYCRQFPYHFYVSDRIKIELDLSCRGVWTGKGADAVSDVSDIVRKADRRLMEALREASAVYNEFYSNCKEAGVMNNLSEIRKSVSSELDNFMDLQYLGNVMESSVEEQCMSLEKMVRKDIDAEEIEEAARESALGSMTSEDPLSVPVYCDERWQWNMFMASGDRIEWKVLDDDGDIKDSGKFNSKDIPFTVPDTSGSAVMKDYVRILNQRDSMAGNVFCMMDEFGYEDDMANAYYGAMSVTVLDVMWRASMLDHLMKTGKGAEGIREAIIFFDMDRLDAPTIGAFV